MTIIVESGFILTRTYRIYDAKYFPLSTSPTSVWRGGKDDPLDILQQNAGVCKNPPLEGGIHPFVIKIHANFHIIAHQSVHLTHPVLANLRLSNPPLLIEGNLSIYAFCSLLIYEDESSMSRN